MTERQADEIQSLRALTLELLGLARNDEWESASSVEAERRPLLYRVLGHLAPGATQEHRQLLEELLSSDREVMRLAQARRDQLGDLVQRAALNRNALLAYETNR